VIPANVIRRLGLDTPRRVALTLTALASASVSIAALLLHVAGWLPMYFLVNMLAAPSLILLLLCGVVASRMDERVFLNRLVTGAWGGIAATISYDLIRAIVWAAGLLSYNPFMSHPVFGSLITGAPEASTPAIVVGWAYHFWNGFGFGVMYTLIAGPAQWYFALGWALLLEVGWLTAMPGLLHFRLSAEFLVVSLSGHGMYGVVLGLIARRFIRE
jgi:hypothetical protein